MQIIQKMMETMGLIDEDLSAQKLETYAGWSSLSSEDSPLEADQLEADQIRLAEYFQELSEQFPDSELQGQIIKSEHSYRFQIVDKNNIIDPYVNDGDSVVIEINDIESAKKITGEFCNNPEASEIVENDIANGAPLYALPSCNI